MVKNLADWLIDAGLSSNWAGYLSWLGTALGVIILAWVSNFIAKKIVLVAVSRFIRKTRTQWDDVLLERRVFSRLSHIAPAVVIYFSAYLFPPLQDLLQRAATVYMILTGLLAFNAFLSAVTDIYRTFEMSKSRPIKGYIQIVKVITAVGVGIVVLATMMNIQVWPILSGLGAMTAVLLLIFKGSILGLVASIQLSGNDMVRLGDWIEMPKYGADGDVVDVTLNTVKVQNWDKTISTIPAYALISESFKNWRGMSESGGRRIKRSISLDMTSVKFCTSEMLDRFEKFQLISEYIRSRRKEIAEHNKEHGIDTSFLVNGRNMTNIGTFRAYVIAYLRNHPKIHKDMTFLVRQLPPGEHGIPIEIYVFSNDQVWANYEAIQSDIFDHILAVISEFDLRVYQYPTGSDLREIVRTVP
ncbi:MAG: mechanosensitive ion channel family protein [Candidatus Zixiibacteriota bacterium]|nr:MAG: mechanosensitive ion channel family protein [candidate division Zixibacteria bacterium]